MTSNINNFDWNNSNKKKHVGITRWEINNFRSVGSGSNAQNLELAPLTVICGENSSGKSTILNSILFVSQIFLDSDNPDSHINQQGSLINLGEFMENLNVTDGGPITADSDIDPTIFKNMFDGFLQFQSSFSIPQDEWGLFDKYFDPSQIHLDIVLNSLLENSNYKEVSELHEEYKNSGMEHFGSKSKDKSRLLKFESEFVKYFTFSSGPFNYFDLPREITIPKEYVDNVESDVEDEGFAEIYNLKVVNKLVDFTKKEINYSNWKNLRFEEELKEKQYLFEDLDSLRKFKEVSLIYSADIGNRIQYIDENYDSYGRYSNKIEPTNEDSVKNYIPQLKNGVPKEKLIRSKSTEQYTIESSQKILTKILLNRKSLKTLLDDQLGIEIPSESYPDFRTFWGNILENNYEAVFGYLDSAPIFRETTSYTTTQKNLQDVNYWKWESNPNEGITFTKHDFNKKDPEHSFFAIERLTGSKLQNLTSKEIAEKFLSFIFENIFQLTETVDKKRLFKFLSGGQEVNNSIFTAYSFNFEEKYVTQSFDKEGFTNQDHFKDFNTFINSNDIDSILDIVITNFVLKHGLTSDELDKIYQDIESVKIFQNVFNLSNYFKNLIKDIDLFKNEPIIFSSDFETINPGQWEQEFEVDYLRDIMIKTIINQFKKVKYIGPLRQLNIKEERNYSFLPNAPLGVNGEQFFNFYEKSKKRTIEVPIPILKVRTNKPEFKVQSTTIEEAMNLWLKYFEIADSFDTEADIELDILKGYVVPKNLNKRIRLDNLGVGFSQLAPIILLCISCKKGDTVLLEQPELHLHPAVQQKFANFALAFAENDIQIILETHSDHLVNRLRRELVESPKNLNNLISIYFVERKKGLSNFNLANVDKFGQYEFKKYPEGFFDQTAEDSLAILKARAKLKENE